MKNKSLLICIIGVMLFQIRLQAQVPVRPAHVIFVLEENYARSEIIGSSYAPTLTALAASPTTVQFTSAYAITHPSEPNYLDLFSGSNQGVTTDLVGPASNAPFNNCNLGASLIAAKFTFIGYAETQPAVGTYLNNSGNYCTKHCPWINWMHGTKDTIPVKSDLPMFPIGTYFPDSNHYSTLPTVSWVIPNLVDDMHDPSTLSTAVSNGDKWFKTNMMPLVRWASSVANNTLVIVIWDEDDGSQSNNIPLLFCGGIVNPGTCTTKVTHFDILRTIEDMYGLTPCVSSPTGVDVPSSIWNLTAINALNTHAIINQLAAWPVPANDELNVKITSANDEKANVGIYDITGRLVKEMPAELKVGDNSFSINTSEISNGVYFLNVIGGKINISRKIVISK